MSIEYTIDVQLAELGFPDILPLRGTSLRETSSPEDSLSPSDSSAALPFTHKEKRLVRGRDAAKQTAEASTPPAPETLRDAPLIPVRELQAEQAAKCTSPPVLMETSMNCLRARPGTTEVSQLMAKDVGEDSDDSEVSEVYEDEDVDEEEEDEDGPNTESSHSGDYRCSVCDLQLPSKFKLEDHMNLHTGARPYCCAECGKRFCQIPNYRVHLRTHAETKVDRIACRVCLMSFVSREDLTEHMSRTHSEDQFYECDLCKRVFTSLKSCEYHVQLRECVQKFTCEACGRSFSSPKSLTRHQKKTHRTFQCTDCTKTFTKKNALLKHSFSHLGLLPYTCVRCRCHFRLARLYHQHKCEPERIHCVACLREFLSQEDFQQHKKDTGCWGNQEPKGDEIRCLECGQRFDTSEELKKHAGAHQRVLKCADCGKGFRSALLLMSHMGGHAGKSPCLCQSCGLGFPHQQNYDSHLKTCGQTPQPASASRKRSTSKSSLPLPKKAKPDSSNPTNPGTAPVKDSPSPGLVTGPVSAASNPPERLWKLALDKQLPPGVKLMFLHVSPTQYNDGTLPSAASLTPLTAHQPFSNKHFGRDATLGSAPLSLVAGIRQDPACEAPLDLSKKSCKPALSDTRLLPVKSEQERCELSGGADATKRQDFKNSHGKVIKTSPGETDPEVRQFEMGHMDLTASSGLTTDVKEEPECPEIDLSCFALI